MNKDGKMLMMGYAVLVMAIMMFGVILFTGSPVEYNVNAISKIPWQPYSEEKVAAAQKAGKPVMIEFFAVWCLPCRQMDSEVFSRDDVALAATNLVALRVDVSVDSNLAARAIAEKYAIQGLPTFVFLGSDGKERTLLRLLGVEEPARIMGRFKAVQ